MTLTPEEKTRIAQIRKQLRKFQRKKAFDTSTWEATFFLKIVDRFVGRE